MHIGKLNLTTRTHNALIRQGITDAERLFAMSDEELMRVRNLPQSSIDEIKRAVYCMDCKRSIYGEYKDCDVNIENDGKYVMDGLDCKCKVLVNAEESHGIRK